MKGYVQQSLVYNRPEISAPRGNRMLDHYISRPVHQPELLGLKKFLRQMIP